ncbi:MAG: T9SS type A sorting domain-containing protein [Bacteroidia bacterium]
MSIKIYRRVTKVALLILFSISIKVTYAQQIQFAKTYPFVTKAAAYSFVQLNDSGFLMAGEYGVSGNGHRAMMIRIDKYGDTLWTKKFPSLGGMYDIIMLDDTTVMVTVSITPITIIKYSINGDSLGAYSYNIGASEVSVAIYKTKDKGYIMSNGSASYGFLKLDSAFNEQWHDYKNMCCGGMLVPDIDGGYVGVGKGGSDVQPYMVQRRDSAGNILWNYQYGNESPWANDDYASDVLILPDSNYLVSCALGNSWQLMKINRNNGDTMWTKEIYPISLTYAMDYYSGNRYLLGGGVDFIIDENGDSLWTSIKSWGMFIAYDIHPTSDGGFAQCGYSGGGASQVISFVKYDSLGNTVFTSVLDPENNLQTLSLYPNPATDKLYINAGTMLNEKKLVFTLTDLQGRSVLNTLYEASTPIDVSALPNGIYIATLKGKEKEVRGKVIIQR